MDSRGVKRGQCEDCACISFQPEEAVHTTRKCVCGHPPGRHVKLDGAGLTMSANEMSEEPAAQLPKCLQCEDEIHVDLNLQKAFKYCEKHLKGQQVQTSVASAVPSTQTDDSDAQPTCAIEECDKPRYKNPDGTVHECCGYTHAMELARRKTTKKSKPVKGVTHCLLPECDRLTWPFMNYCGKTHAEMGKKRGLVPKLQVKDSTHCLLPECFKTKYSDHMTGEIFDFCGKSHAAEARRRGIELETGNVVKDDSICIIPECTRPKWKDPTSKDAYYDFCSKTHAAEAKRRNIEPILTSKSNVLKFLHGFGALTVVDLEENDHAKPGGVLYNKFVDARNHLPQNCRKTCLAFHGTPEANIQNICKSGYDPSRRCGQAHGPGEYFATTPDIPLGYCGGGKKMLLNELLLGQVDQHHKKTGNIVVMKNPEHDLPRFVITFK